MTGRKVFAVAFAGLVAAYLIGFGVLLAVASPFVALLLPAGFVVGYVCGLVEGDA